MSSMGVPRLKLLLTKKNIKACLTFANNILMIPKTLGEKSLGTDERKVCVLLHLV